MLKEIGVGSDQNNDDNENEEDANWEEYETDSEDDTNGMDQS